MAAAVTPLSSPVSTPICVAVTMNGSDVACSRPAATTERRSKSRENSSAGNPRTTSSATRNTGTRASAAGFSIRPLRSSRSPLLTKNTGIRKP